MASRRVSGLRFPRSGRRSRPQPPAVLESKADVDAVEPSFDYLLENARWKWAMRKRVRELLRDEDISKMEWHTFPAFADAYLAAEQLRTLPAFQTAKCVKVSAGETQKPVRIITLREMKKLVVPDAKTGGFSMLIPTAMSDMEFVTATTSGAGDSSRLGKPLGVYSKFKVDVIVLGSVAVDPTTGARLGKGRGTTDLAYGLLRWMGAVDESTVVITTVHDKQLVDKLPACKMLAYDVPVDIICTPTQIIHTNTTFPKPTGIYWNRITPQKLVKSEALTQLKELIEKQSKKEVVLAPSHQTLPQLPHAVNGPAFFISGINPRITEAELYQQLVKVGVAVKSVSFYRENKMRINCVRVVVAEGSDMQQQKFCINVRLELNAAVDKLVYTKSC